MRTLPVKPQPIAELKTKISEVEAERNQYKALAEAYEFQNDTLLKPAMDSIPVSGAIYSMYMELEAYGRKSGHNEKYLSSKNRINLILEHVTNTSKIHDHNYRLRHQLKQSIYERDQLEQKVARLEAELEAINKAWNEE